MPDGAATASMLRCRRRGGNRGCQPRRKSAPPQTSTFSRLLAPIVAPVPCLNDRSGGGDPGVARAASRTRGGTSGSTFPRTRASRVLWRDLPAMLLPGVVGAGPSFFRRAECWDTRQRNRRSRRIVAAGGETAWITPPRRSATGGGTVAIRRTFVTARVDRERPFLELLEGARIVTSWGGIAP
jgi:hypothetical protein